MPAAACREEGRKKTETCQRFTTATLQRLPDLANLPDLEGLLNVFVAKVLPSSFAANKIVMFRTLVVAKHLCCEGAWSWLNTCEGERVSHAVWGWPYQRQASALQGSGSQRQGRARGGGAPESTALKGCPLRRSRPAAAAGSQCHRHPVKHFFQLSCSASTWLETLFVKYACHLLDEHGWTSSHLLIVGRTPYVWKFFLSYMTHAETWGERKQNKMFV